ncbi:hypothetical protein ACTXMB_14595 [Arthrobacter rhombi]|uniref:hypothetical protein n=1 Tax=Arthrobacter rhombi TaxID=71253 RepID=UPI003FD3DF1D
MDEEVIKVIKSVAPILLPLAFAALGRWIKGRSGLRKSRRTEAHFVDDIERIKQLDGLAKEVPVADLSSAVVSFRVREEMIVRLAPNQWVTNTLLFVQGSLLIVLARVYAEFEIIPELWTWVLFGGGILVNLLWVGLLTGLGQHRRRLEAIVDAEDAETTEAAGSKKIRWLEGLSTGPGGAEVTKRLVDRFVSLRKNGELNEPSGQE